MSQLVFICACLGIQIYLKALPNGLVLKNPRFKFLLEDAGFVSDTIEIADTDDDDWDGDIPWGTVLPRQGSHGWRLLARRFSRP